jgi:hypothetical protein
MEVNNMSNKTNTVDIGPAKAGTDVEQGYCGAPLVNECDYAPSMGKSQVDFIRRLIYV